MVDYNRLLVNFLSESEGILEESEDAVLQLEKDSSPETIDKIFRAVHTIKGNSGLFDLPKIRELSHSMENSLNHFRNHPPDYIPEAIIDLYLSTVDRLKSMISDVKNSNEVDITDLVESYNQLMDPKKKVDSPAETTPTNPATENEEAQEKPDNARSTKALPSPNSFPKNLKIAIQKKYLNQAVEKEEYLSLVLLQPSLIPGVSRLDEMVRFFQEGEKNGIIKISTVSELLPEWESAGKNTWKVFFLLQSIVEPKVALESLGLRAEAIRIIYNPATKEKAGKSQSAASINGSMPAEGGENSDRELATSSQVANPKDLEWQKKDTESGNAAISALSQDTRDTNLKVSLRLIDDLINLAGEAVIARNELLQKIDANADSNLHTSAKKIGTLFSKLQEGIMKTRLQELDSVFQKVPRIVRDISRTTGKHAELVQFGGEVELDKTLIDAISDPIMHMIRNSMDHGIETPEERLKAGKPKEGFIRLSASLRGGNVIIAIEDDGKGLDRNTIQEKVIEKGIMPKEAAEAATDEEIFNCVFLPGFSTAKKVTTVSGRGVGMDVVRTNLKKVGGSAEIANRPEGGSIVTLTIPQTLSIVTTLLIRTAGRRYAVPEQNVKELILVNPQHLSKVETHLIYNLRDHLLPVLDLANFLKLPVGEDYKPQYMAVLKSEKHSFGILIDEIINPEEIVVKSLGSLFTGLNIFSGATIMGDGETVLILDVPGMAKFWSMQSNIDEKELNGQNKIASSESSANNEVKGFLLFSIGKQQFAVSVESVPRIEKIKPTDISHFQGIEVILYRNVSVPLVRLDEFYDLDHSLKGENEEEIYGIFFRLDGTHTGFIANSVDRVINDMPKLKTDTYSGEGILGYEVIDGVHTIFLDIKKLTEKLHSEKFHDLEIVPLEEEEVA